MSGNNHTNNLAADIAIAVKRNYGANHSQTLSRGMIVVGVAIAVLQTQSASALSISEMRVQSALGEPFRGTVTARIGAGESLRPDCFSAASTDNPVLADPGKLAIRAPAVTRPGEYQIELTTLKPLYEPMYEFRLHVNCAGEAALSRDYTVMLNLPMLSPALQTNTTAPVATERQASRRTTQASADSQRPATQISTPKRKIPSGSRYAVRSGDTLSGIAERIDGRPAGTIWKTSQLLFRTNPQAFAGGDPDRIKFGAELNIPDAAQLVAGLNKANAPVTQQVAPAPAAPITPKPTPESIRTVDLSKPQEPKFSAPTEIPADSALLANNETTRTLVQADLRKPVQVAKTAPDIQAKPEKLMPVRQTPAVEPTRSAFEPISPVSGDTGDSNLTAILAGSLIGFILFVLLLGRDLFAPLLNGRKNLLRREPESAAEEPGNPDTDNSMATGFAGDDDDTINQQGLEDTANVEAKFADAAPETSTHDGTEAFPDYGSGGIDVRLTEDDSTLDNTVDMDIGADSLDDEDSAYAPTIAERPAIKEDVGTAINELFDMGIDGDDDDTGLFSVSIKPGMKNNPPDAKAGAEQPGESTDQLKQLLEDQLENSDPLTGDTTSELFEDSEGPTVEVEMFKDMKHDLQSLAEVGDDKASATLTQALELLTQDYEDELSSSQILERHQIDAALAEERAKITSDK